MIFSRKEKSQAPTITRDEALSGVPVVNPVVTVTERDNSTLLLEYPLAFKPLFSELLKKFSKQEEQEVIKKLELDEMGSEVFALIDGTQTVRNIILTFAKDKDITLQEAETAITTYLRELGKRKIIAIK